MNLIVALYWPDGLCKSTQFGGTTITIDHLRSIERRLSQAEYIFFKFALLFSPRRAWDFSPLAILLSIAGNPALGRFGYTHILEILAFDQQAPS